VATVHFANCDSGAMVTCISSGVLEAFPIFSQYLVKSPDVVYGLADNPVEIIGVLKRIPISLGSEQEKGSIVHCDFKVIK
jgi:hypothetical protein